MTGKLMVWGFALMALLFGGALYYSQVYAYYQDVSDTTRPAMVRLADGSRTPIPYADLSAIDATSSPIRFRACFTTPLSQAELTAGFEPYAGATPLIAPGWFDCFDAVAIGKAIEAGDAIAFVDRRDIREGVDRVIAVFADGRAYAWHQLNEKLAE